MSGISSSIGLISGINTAQLIEQLLSLEARPKVFAQTRLTQLKAEQGAFLGFNSILLGLKTASEAFRKDKLFDAKTATSSNTNLLTATASTSAQAGSYQFLVERLVSSSQKISRGFIDADTTAIGATEFSFEFGNGRVSSETRLSDLNGGGGVSRGNIKITDSAGDTATINLSRAVTLDDVIEAINTETTIKVSASVSGDGLKITDGAGGGGELTIVDDTGYSTATDLGIAAADSDDGNADGVITGTKVQFITGDTGLTTLNDDNGVLISSGLGTADFRIQTADGVVHDIVLGKRDDGNDGTDPPITTIQGVLDRINELAGSPVTAALAADGISLQLVDNTSGGSTFEVQAGALGNQTVIDLGLEAPAVGNTISGTRLMAGLNSVLLKSLNGGSGTAASQQIDITNRSGSSSSIDISSAQSLQEVIDLINDDVTLNGSITASFNESGNGLRITDNTGSTTSNLIIRTNDGDTNIFGIDTGVAGIDADSVKGTNLQMQYVAGSSLLSELNYGRGIGTGTFEITDGTGSIAQVNIGDDAKTLQDIISEINTRPIEVNARLNDTGDGIIIESTTANPTVAMSITSISGNVAKDLNIIGTAAGSDAVDNFIDGSYERTVVFDATDTLDEIIDKINAEGIPVGATLINDGGTTPYRLSLSSEITGTAGDLIIETNNFDLGLSSLSEAQDSVVFFGNSDPARGILMTSSSNTLSNVITGVSIDLVGTSNDVVNLTIANDTTKMVKAVNDFLEAFNKVVDRIDSLDSFDTESKKKGILLGNPTVARVRSQLYRVLQGEAQGMDTQFERLVQLGVTVGSGGQLEFNETRFREALEDDYEAVKAVFSAYELSEDQTRDLGGGVVVESDTLLFDSLGVGEQVAQLLHGLTNSIDGTLTRVNNNYNSIINLQQKRIEAFDVRLEQRRVQLTRQFAAMETALAALQGQQSALASFRPLY